MTGHIGAVVLFCEGAEWGAASTLAWGSGLLEGGSCSTTKSRSSTCAKPAACAKSTRSGASPSAKPSTGLVTEQSTTCTTGAAEAPCVARSETAKASTGARTSTTSGGGTATK